jgi:hypothetical protein
MPERKAALEAELEYLRDQQTLLETMMLQPCAAPASLPLNGLANAHCCCAGRRRGSSRIETAWRDIASAPRDGQWFWALNKRTGRTYHACWSPERQCFVNTERNNRVNPTHWRWAWDD